jgi:peptide/nickel transport system ATP-binding protein
MPKTGSRAWREQRAQMQMVFQNPLGSFDRRMTIFQSVGEPLTIHRIGESFSERTFRVSAVLNEVGLLPEHAQCHPHQLSGGQLQRAAIARALITEPRVLVLDEPVSALDVSIQARIVAMLMELQQTRGLAALMISHDIRLVRQICDEVAVMYLGRIVEQGTPEAVFQNPQHPYTMALVSAVPKLTRDGSTRAILKGEPPNPAMRPSGCAFHPRCAMAVERCKVDTPALLRGDDNRLVACHLVTPKTEQIAP